ncbi:hypothetical protein [Actinomadura sediminis]|uniref:Cation transporter n=1 Tax=Actinomadura sediminis TaxID=1038904 RepID=A0ABW3F0F0_9ACTN
MELAVNSLFGWTWADPIAALVIAAVAVKEGREAWRGDACCSVPPPAAMASSQLNASACRTCEPGCSCCTTDLEAPTSRSSAPPQDSAP